MAKWEFSWDPEPAAGRGGPDPRQSVAEPPAPPPDCPEESGWTTSVPATIQSATGFRLELDV